MTFEGRLVTNFAVSGVRRPVAFIRMSDGAPSGGELGNINTTLAVEHLCCKSPMTAITDLWVYLPDYNLLIHQSPRLSDQTPRQPSFTHTVQIWMALQQHGGTTQDALSIHVMLVLLPESRVELRYGRLAPRDLLRHPNPPRFHAT